MKALITSAVMALNITLWVVLIVKGVRFEQDCSGYLKRAADASTIETASEELQTTITYAEANNLTTGYTSVLYETPDEDISFWYNNLKSAQAELEKVDSTTSQLERTNILMKLRETLTDHGEKRVHVTMPEGLYKYPHNVFFCVLSWLSCFSVIAIFLLWAYWLS